MAKWNNALQSRSLSLETRSNTLPKETITKVSIPLSKANQDKGQLKFIALTALS